MPERLIDCEPGQLSGNLLGTACNIELSLYLFRILTSNPNQFVSCLFSFQVRGIDVSLNPSTLLKSQSCSRPLSRLLGLVVVALLVLTLVMLVVGTTAAAPAMADSTSDELNTGDSEPGVPLSVADGETPSDGGIGQHTTFDDSTLGTSSSYSTTFDSADISLETVSVPNTISAYTEDVSPPILVVLGSYSRYDSSDPLGNDIRAAVHERVQSEPGVTLAQLTEDNGVSESTVRYHTRILEEESLLQRVELWGNVRAFPTTYGPTEQALTVALADTAKLSVLSAVEEHQPTTVNTVAAEIDRAPSTVSHHLTRLDETGLVDRERSGKKVLTTLEPTVKQALNGGNFGTDNPKRGVGD